MDRHPDAAVAVNRRPWLPLRALSGWTAKDLNGDLAAGITLAAIAIPEQMATARRGGFAPEIRFFAFVAGSLAFALLGDNRHLSVGADSTITPLFAGGLALIATVAITSLRPGKPQQQEQDEKQHD
jgi:SulP family sulfate permease